MTMALSTGVIAGIVVACILAIVLIAITIYCIIKRRKRNGEYQERCGQLWEKYGNRDKDSGAVASFPNPDPSFVPTSVPAQNFTPRELKQGGFVIPGKGYSEEVERQPLLSMHEPINPDGLNPKLYGEGEYATSSADTAESSDERPPQIHFSVEYDEKFSILKIFIDHANHLRPPNYTTTCNPYCVVSLLPSHLKEKQSHVQRHTVNPVFKENFSFGLAKDELKHSYIQIKFFEYDQFSRDECVGIVIQRLDEINLSSKVDLWKRISLTSGGETSKKSGDLLLRLGYLPSAEKLTVVLLKARSLKEVGAEDDMKAPDPYIRVSVFHNGNLLKKKKTSTKKKTCNPTYNQAINFSIPLQVLPQVEIHFDVVHEPGPKLNRFEKKEVIGSLEIGPNSSGDEKDHWRDLMSNKPQARWHGLMAIVGDGKTPQDDSKESSSSYIQKA